MRRFDLYGYLSSDLERLAAQIEAELRTTMRLRDSLYAGLYYAGGEGTPAPLVLQRNEVGSRWHSQFPQYGATLTVSELPDMDEIADRLTSGRDGPVLLRSIIHQDEPPDDSED